jgi:Flp pilus assembly protein CpaB
MEAQQARERRRRRQTLIGALILAIIAAGATYYVLSRPGGGDGTGATRTIVVAAASIPAGTVIAEEMLTTVEVPDNPVFALADTTPAAATGKVALVAIAAGQAIQGNLYRVGSQSGGVAILEPGETISPDSPVWRAVSVQVPAERAVGGVIKAGDHVDLYVTLEIKIYDATGTLTDAAIPGGYIPGTSTKVTWTNLEVLQVDEARDLYIFRVDATQAEEIAHVQGSGANSFTLSLRAAEDDRELVREEYGRTTNTLIEIYGFPIPQIIFLPGGPTLAPGQSPAPPASPVPSPAPSP